MKYSLSEENYLKAIFHLEHKLLGEVSTNAIADRMETKASSVTDMVKKLSAKGLVDYVKYQGVTLTEEGRKTALKIIRKHRLWEVFLVDKLNFQWDEVHDIAEQLEHVESDELVQRLDTFLEYPDFDPHGDPIPDEKGNLKSVEKKLLSELGESQRGVCVGVRESNSDFLRYLDKRNIGIGTKIVVQSKEYFDESMVVQVAEQQFSISQRTAENIYVQTIVE